MVKKCREKPADKRLKRVEPEMGAYSGNGISDTEVRRQDAGSPGRSELDVRRGQRSESHDIRLNHSAISIIRPDISEEHALDSLQSGLSAKQERRVEVPASTINHSASLRGIGPEQPQRTSDAVSAESENRLVMKRASRVELPDIAPNHSSIGPKPKPSPKRPSLRTAFRSLYSHVKNAPKRRDK
jgi:hypothetical protein